MAADEVYSYAANDGKVAIVRGYNFIHAIDHHYREWLMIREIRNKIQWEEKLVERKVTYTLEVDGQLIVIENVPARVNLETGEQLFSPNTVEHLQKMIWQRSKPKRMIQVPVYEYA